MSDKAKDILEWIFYIIIAVVLAFLFRYYIGTPTIVKHKSMYPTLKPDQRVALNRTFRITKRKPKVGDIVTFEAPAEDKSFYTTENVDQNNPVAVYNEVKGLWNRFLYYKLEVTKTSYIKRVIAIEGQHVVIKDNSVYIDEKYFDESNYLSSDVKTESSIFNDFIVPEGYVFCMGDNRTQSVDCRVFGCIPLEKIEGIVLFRFWPLDVFGKIDN